MSIYRSNCFNPDGRLRGSYVYMLLCWVEELVHIKIGRSSNPLARLEKLKRSCPVTPDAMSVADLHSHRKAVLVERELHAALERWHSHRSWFVVPPLESALFNCACKPVMAAHSSASRKIVWSHFSVPALAEEAEKRRQIQALTFTGRSFGYRRFAKNTSTS